MVSASINPVLLIILPFIFYILHKWPKSKVEIIETSRVGIFRRIAAFYIDMVVAIIGVFPLMCMPILILEYLETGKWVWTFQRDYFRLTDILSIVIMLGGFLGIAYYSRWHFINGKQTLGQHLLKFNLTPREPIGQDAQYSIRVLIAWVNLAWWPIWPWTIMKRKQDYWWDTASNIKARMVNKL